MKRLLLILFICLPTILHAQKNKTLVNGAKQQSEKPKLVIGLVIDQMCWDYLHRYKNEYTGKGFLELMRNGFSCDNTMITHIPTYTAVGHTGVYTGSYPSIHGIVRSEEHTSELPVTQ